MGCAFWSGFWEGPWLKSCLELGEGRGRRGFPTALSWVMAVLGFRRVGKNLEYIEQQWPSRLTKRSIALFQENLAELFSMNNNIHQEGIQYILPLVLNAMEILTATRYTTSSCSVIVCSLDAYVLLAHNDHSSILQFPLLWSYCSCSEFGCAFLESWDHVDRERCILVGSWNLAGSDIRVFLIISVRACGFLPMARLSWDANL